MYIHMCIHEYNYMHTFIHAYIYNAYYHSLLVDVQTVAPMLGARLTELMMTQMQQPLMQIQFKLIYYIRICIDYDFQT